MEVRCIERFLLLILATTCLVGRCASPLLPAPGTPDTDLPRRREVPDWFLDAKLGVIVHYGLYSVPGWAPRTGELVDEVARAGWDSWFSRHPGAEFYLNSLRISGSPVAARHAEMFGKTMPYTSFAPVLIERSRAVDSAGIARWFKGLGFQYLIFTAKHHDGHLLWPGQWFRGNEPLTPTASEHDFVSEWADSSRKAGLRFGVYYSSGMDWSFVRTPVTNAADLFISGPPQTNYLSSVDRHWRDLIQRARPDILWNDLGVPRDLRVQDLIDEYYDAVPQGVVNDRFSLGLFPGAKSVHADFRTPLIADLSRQQGRVFEVMRPLGKSFGYQSQEREEDLISFNDLVRTFVEVVSRNGRLLIGVGPSASGEISPWHRTRLEQLGAWMKVHGESISATRPWHVSALKSPEGVELRFTQRGTNLYVHCFGLPNAPRVTLEPVRMMPESKISVIGSDRVIAWNATANRLVVDLPNDSASKPVTVFRISPQPVWLLPP